MASKVLYSLLGGIVGPISGAVAGYMYADARNELDRLEGRPETNSPVLSGFIGYNLMIFAGPYYGYHLADTKNRIEEVKAAKASAETAAPATPTPTPPTDSTPMVIEVPKVPAIHKANTIPR